MEEINWNIVGDNKIKRKFIIPVGRRKKWWEFWKKDKSIESLKILLKSYKEEMEFDGDLLINGEGLNATNNLMEKHGKGVFTKNDKKKNS